MMVGKPRLAQQIRHPNFLNIPGRGVLQHPGRYSFAGRIDRLLRHVT